jgi:hypothetical protein
VSETKEEIAAERDALRAEVENLRGQLSAAGVRRPTVAEHVFELSEGQRQELATLGYTNIGGVRVTRDDVKARLTERQANIDLGDAEPVDAGLPRRVQGATPGVDFVYPSVAPGRIDPAVAGTPGINGPALETTPAPAGQE